jgi:threonine synthase
MMDSIPRLPSAWFANLPSLSLVDIAIAVAEAFLAEDIDAPSLRQIVETSCTFPAPLRPLGDRGFVLELFHGPTLAFKDFGARFLARVMGHIARGEGGDLHVLVATSGDTGGAVAHAFSGVEGTRVFVLYPSGKVTPTQERQFTTFGGNITALEVDGTFDDCQRLVKNALLDPELNERLRLTSANSINVARLLPQSFYYIAAFAQVSDPSLPLVFSVPSGNFGNLTAGIIAKRMGLPVRTFVAATNANDVVPQFLRTGIFQPRSSVSTVSNAMDVGNPSNFARIVDLYGGSAERMCEDVVGFSFPDDATLDMIRRVDAENGYLIDPHGAVALLGLEAYRLTHPGPVNGIALATAHPGKFPRHVEHAIGRSIAIPDSLRATLNRKKKSVPLENAPEALKRVLLSETRSGRLGTFAPARVRHEAAA